MGRGGVVGFPHSTEVPESGEMFLAWRGCLAVSQWGKMFSKWEKHMSKEGTGSSSGYSPGEGGWRK